MMIWRSRGLRVLYASLDYQRAIRGPLKRRYSSCGSNRSMGSEVAHRLGKPPPKTLPSQQQPAESSPDSAATEGAPSSAPATQAPTQTALVKLASHQMNLHICTHVYVYRRVHFVSTWICTYMLCKYLLNISCLYECDLSTVSHIVGENVC